MKISGIYKITNLINKKIYIGSAVNISQRKSVHFYDLKNNWHSSIKLQRSFNKHGENNFKFEIIEEVANVKNLIKREQYYLNKFLFANENDDRFIKLGYNICREAGSSLGYKHTDVWKEEAKKRKLGKKGTACSEQTKIAIAKANKGRVATIETRKKMSIARAKYLTLFGHPAKGSKRKGRPHTIKSKERLRQAHLGKKASEATKLKMSLSHRKTNISVRKAVVQLDKLNNVIAEFVSVKEGVEKTKILGIGAACRGIVKTAGNYKWKFKDVIN